jgi:hypothetical protein
MGYPSPGAVYSFKNLGFKVFMDARMPVTHEEGDRYPLEPPVLFQCSTAVVQLTVNQLVVGSIPATGASFCQIYTYGSRA